MPDADEYLELLEWAAYGEAFGELLFSVMASEVGDERQRTSLELLAALEQHVSERLSPLLEDAGLALRVLTDDERAKTTALARDLVANGWAVFLRTFGPETARTLKRYERLRELSPNADAPELILLVQHEQALARFAELELADAPGPAAKVITDVIG